MNSWTNDRDRLLSLAKSVDSSVILTTKDGFFWKAISWILFIISFGKQSRKTFLTIFATTIGPIQAYPKEWSVQSVEFVVVHESRHTKQFRWFGFGLSPWVGIPFMFIFYIFLKIRG